MIYNHLLLQESASYSMIMLSDFHDFSLGIISGILTFVGGLTYSVIFNNYFSSNSVSVTMEIIWTIIPMVILVILVLPSLKLLYYMEEGNPVLTFKVMGHQWYWSYELEGSKDSGFDSYMDPSGDYRLLDVDHRMVLPYDKDVRALISSDDVLHCWTVPALGVKMDAVPGRLNQIMIHSLYPSILYGQCSEICGANHSFMPIVVESINYNNFLEWCMI